MKSSFQVDVYVAPAIATATGHVDPSKTLFSPICCTLIQGPDSAVLVDTPTTVQLAEGLAEGLSKPRPGKHYGISIRLTRTTIISSATLSSCAIFRKLTGIDMWKQLFPNGQVADNQFPPTALPKGGEFTIDGMSFHGIDVPYSDTEASSFLHVPELRLAVCGDIVYGECHQFFGEASTPEKRQMWLKSLEQIAALDPHIVVPGHKRPTQVDGPHLISATRDYILAFEAELERLGDAEKLEKSIVEKFPRHLNKFLLEWSCKSSNRKP